MNIQFALSTAPIMARVLQAQQNNILASHEALPQSIAPSIPQSGRPNAARHVSTSYNQSGATTPGSQPILPSASRTPPQIQAGFTSSHFETDPIILSQRAQANLSVPPAAEIPRVSALGALRRPLAYDTIAPAFLVAPLTNMPNATSSIQPEAGLTSPFQPFLSAQTGPLNEQHSNLPLGPFKNTQLHQALAGYHQHTLPTLHSKSVATSMEPSKRKGKGKARFEDLDEPSNAGSPPAPAELQYPYGTQVGNKDQQYISQSQFLSSAAGPSRTRAQRQAEASSPLENSNAQPAEAGPSAGVVPKRNSQQRCKLSCFLNQITDKLTLHTFAGPAHRKEQKKNEPKKDGKKPADDFHRRVTDKCRNCRLWLAASSLVSSEGRKSNRNRARTRTESTFTWNMKRAKENELRLLLSNRDQGLAQLQQTLDQELYDAFVEALDRYLRKRGKLPNTWIP